MLSWWPEERMVTLGGAHHPFVRALLRQAYAKCIVQPVKDWETGSIMPSMPKLLVLSLCTALVVAGSAEARRIGGGRSVGMKVESAAPSMTASTVHTPVINGASSESAVVRAVTGADMKTAVVGGVTAGMARAALRNANAEAQSDPSPATPGGMPQQYASAPTGESPLSTAAAESRLRKLDADLERERAAKALAARLFDQTADKAGEIEKPPVKTPAEIAREKKEAAEKAAAARIEEERRMKLAREQACRIEPVMSDKAIANCRKIFRET